MNFYYSGPVKNNNVSYFRGVGTRLGGAQESLWVKIKNCFTSGTQPITEPSVAPNAPPSSNVHTIHTTTATESGWKKLLKDPIMCNFLVGLGLMLFGLGVGILLGIITGGTALFPGCIFVGVLMGLPLLGMCFYIHHKMRIES